VGAGGGVAAGGGAGGPGCAAGAGADGGGVFGAFEFGPHATAMSNAPAIDIAKYLASLMIQAPT
jgi:hypothetical protein